MNGLQELDTAEDVDRRTVGAVNRARIVSEVVLGVALVALIPAFVVEDPNVGWVTVLVGALILMDAAIALGLRQWVRDRLG